MPSLFATLPFFSEIPGIAGHYLFHDPLWLAALPAVFLVLWLRRRKRMPVLVVPFASAWHRPSLRSSSRLPVTLALLGLVLLVVALARPQRVDDKREVRAKGYDLILAIDLSGSMQIEDYIRNGERINRLQAIKPVIQSFIQDRPDDRVGIVLFAGTAYTMAPLTFDHNWLVRQIERIKIGVISDDGTAIGDGLGIALTRLDQAKHETEGKRMGAFVILLTDGANNKGVMQPVQASDIAKARRIPVYTIGAGKEGTVPFPVGKRADGSTIYTPQFSQIDEGLLRMIASETGGRFFRADDIDTVEQAFAAIDQAQKIEFQGKSYLLTTELFPWFAIPGCALLLIAALLTRRSSGV